MRVRARYVSLFFNSNKVLLKQGSDAIRDNNPIHGWRFVKKSSQGIRTRFGHVQNGVRHFRRKQF